MSGGEISRAIIPRAVLPVIFALEMGSVVKGCTQEDKKAGEQSGDFTSGFCVETNEAGETVGYYGQGTLNSRGEVCQDGQFVSIVAGPTAVSPSEEAKYPSPTPAVEASPIPQKQVVFQVTNMEKPGAQSGQRETEYLWYAIGAATVLFLAGNLLTHQNSSRR